MNAFVDLLNSFIDGFAKGLVIMACIKYLWGF